MPEIIMILLVVLLLFGGRKIPELMRGLGKGIREFNDAKNNERTTKRIIIISGIPKLPIIIYLKCKSNWIW